MKLSELIAQLQEVQENLSDAACGNDERVVDPEIRMAVQPSWPLCHDLDAVTLETNSERGEGTILWLAASQGHPWGENPYAPKQAWGGFEFDSKEEEEEKS